MRVIHCAGRDALASEEAAAVAAAASGGGVLLFPTDTLYGLGVDPRSPAGLAAIFRLKGRDPGQPLPVLLADAALVGTFAAAVPDTWRALMARFWPGPLTLLFPAPPGLPEAIRSSAGKVALRVPGSAVCRSVLRAAGGSLTGTSANPSGAGGTGDPLKALRGLAGAVDIFVDAGVLPPSPASTVLDLDATGAVTSVRAGAVHEDAWRRAVEEATGRVVTSRERRPGR
jgi:L-threonylcarbamoyladenylate synthase